MKVALYARVSTDKQDIQNQLPALRAYAQRQGHEIYQEYIDEAQSGAKESRPAFDAMLNDMRRCKFGAIIVTKLDRIGRSLKHILSLFEEFNSKGVGFIALDQNIDTSNAAGRLQMQIIGAFAEFERNLISDRTKAARANRPMWGKRGPDKKPRKKRGGFRKRIVYPQFEVSKEAANDAPL